MMKNPDYGGFIWTHHALERIGQRGLSQYYVAETVKNPANVTAGKQSGTTEYQKNYKESIISVITKTNEKGKIIVVSCWVDPPLYGSAEWKEKQNAKEYRKATSWWKQLWMVLKKQLNL